MENGNALLPAGVIMMWWGSVSSVPGGWVLCDGTNGAPDLRDRFVVGAGSSYSPGDTGGAGTVTLTEAQMPAHGHGIPEHSHELRTYNHQWRNNGQYYPPHLSYGDEIYRYMYVANTLMEGDTTSTTWQNSQTTFSAGGGQAHENRPPYYALCYIMKA